MFSALIITALVGIVVFSVFLSSVAELFISVPQVVCTRCGHSGVARRVTPGSFLVELILWLCLLVPGLVYSVWRIRSKRNVCTMCGSTEVVPRHSPVGQQLLKTFAPESPATQQANTPISTPPSTDTDIGPFMVLAAIVVISLFFLPLRSCS